MLPPETTRRPPPVGEPPVEKPAVPPGPVIMVVDDDAEMRALLREVLDAEGFTTLEENSGQSLLGDLDLAVLDLLVLDKEMPGPSGLDLLSYIARRRPALPVVLMTAFGGTTVREEALRLGAVSYLEKPFTADALVREVFRLLALVGAPGARGAQDDG